MAIQLTVVLIISTAEADRCRLFYFIYQFIVGWDPVCLAKEKRRVATRAKTIRRSSLSSQDGSDRRRSINLLLQHRRPSLRLAYSNVEHNKDSQHFDEGVIHEIEQSELAFNVPHFPDDLLGGPSSPVCRKVRSMFGYAQQSDSE